MRPRPSALMLVWLLACNGTGVAVVSANVVPAHAATDTCHPAELYATDDTDPTGTDQLRLFELEADATITHSGATVTGSTLVDGVFWSDDLHQVTTERARQFHLCVDDEPTLREAADAVRRRFDQQTVLTFDYLPTSGNATTITVPDIDPARFQAAFAADSVARQQLQGGSITSDDHTLILVAAKDDLDIARRLIGASGGDWTRAATTDGNREFVR